jgi:hypothetical protein
MIVGGGTSQATATPTPPEAAPTYTWESLSPSVATINSATGVITPVSVGTTTIRATPSDGGPFGEATFTVRGPSTTVVISAVYGGGGNASATYNQDFVQLYNLTASTINLNGWSLQAASQASDQWGTRIALLSGNILPNSFYLIGFFKNPSNVGANLPNSDASHANIADINSSNLANDNGKFAVVNSITPLTGLNPINNLRN